MNAWAEHVLRSLSDDDLRHNISPGRNHGIWILGHVVWSQDHLAQYLGQGGFSYPDLVPLFASGTELRGLEHYPSAAELRALWPLICAKNAAIIADLSDDQLDDYHAMIEGDPEQDYFKTKENCIINWTLHELYHFGQLAMLAGRDKQTTPA